MVMLGTASRSSELSSCCCLARWLMYVLLKEWEITPYHQVLHLEVPPTHRLPLPLLQAANGICHKESVALCRDLL